MKVLRTAVIGLGRIGWGRHIPNVISHEGFELVAAMDTDEARRKELWDTYGVQGYSDLNEMLTKEKPDLVIVASPTHLHRDHIITAMEHGADVFAEKPVAKDMDEVYEIHEAAKRMGRKILVYQPHRANAVINTLKAIIKQNKIGRLVMVKRANSSYIRRNDWQAIKEFGGGMLNNYGAHFMDQFLYLLEEDLDVLACTCDCAATLGDADDVVQVMMKSSSGVALDLNINQAAAYPMPAWIVYGKYGAIFAQDEFCEEFKVKYIIPEECPPIELCPSLAALNRKYSNDLPLPWHEETVQVSQENEIDFYEKCYEYYALDKESFVPFEQTMQIMSLINKCRSMLS